MSDDQQVGLVEVRVRHADDDVSNGTPAFQVPWDQLEAARAVFSTWGVYDASDDEGDVYQEAFGQMVVRRGPKGEVWFDVGVENG